MCSAPHEIWRRVELPPEPHLRLIFQTVLRSAAWEPEGRLPAKQVCFCMNLQGSNGSLSHPTPSSRHCSHLSCPLGKHLALGSAGLACLSTRTPKQHYLWCDAPEGVWGAFWDPCKGRRNNAGQRHCVHGAGEPSLSVACTPATADARLRALKATRAPPAAAKGPPPRDRLL